MTPFQADLSEAFLRAEEIGRERARTQEFREVRQCVVELLQRRLGIEISNLRRASYQISHWVLRAQQTGELPLSGGTTWNRDSDYKNFLHGIETLIQSGRVLLEQNEDLRRELCSRGFSDHPDIRSFAAESQRLSRFLEDAETFKSSGGKPRSSDQRSYWHGQARAFAKIIETECDRSGLSCPTRDSDVSALVIAVADLLKLSGLRDIQDATVRKALVGKSRAA